MVTVQQLLDEKGRSVWTTSPATSVYDVLGIMAEKNVGAIVVAEGGRVVGMFSERDYARKVTLLGRRSRELSVGEIMSPGVIHVTLRHTIDQCMQIMTEKHIRHLPVVEEGKLEGLISIGDVVRCVIEDQRSTINHLEDYITGRKS
ncbi:MAG: CBS domain-containing protein [Bacteroidota bacterium]